MSTLRYIAIFPGTVLAWILALFITLRINLYRAILFCPENAREGADCYVVGWVTYPWWLVSFGAALSAVFVILATALLAPSNKLKCCKISYMIWGSLAAVLGISGAIVPCLFALLAGGLTVLLVSYLTKRETVSADRPTSVDLVGWFFMISGSLSILNAIGSLLVHYQTPSNSFGLWFGVVQILVAGGFVVAGALFLRGSAPMRQALEYGAYLLAIAIIAYGIYGINFSSDVHSALLFGMAVLTLLLSPLFFVVKGLRSQKVRNYVCKT